MLGQKVLDYGVHAAVVIADYEAVTGFFVVLLKDHQGNLAEFSGKGLSVVPVKINAKSTVGYDDRIKSCDQRIVVKRVVLVIVGGKAVLIGAALPEIFY